MAKMDVSKELRVDIEKNQSKLKIAIRNHQMLLLKLKADPDNVMLKYDLKAAQSDIVSIGLDQKELIERLRRELKVHHKNVKTNSTKAGVDDRRCNLTNILSKSRKQTLTSRSASVSSVSTSEDSLDVPSSPPSPAPPLLPHELSQVDFLGRMGLCTHDVFKELQNKRVERKRRSTANPHFLYGNRWDHSTKRKKNAYLMSLSPPNTRQATKNKLKEQQQQQQRVSPPLTQLSNRSDSRSSSPVNSGNSNASNGNKKPPTAVPIGLNIPNLPSGLTIERVNGNKHSLEGRVCLVCRTTGSLSVCETCSGSFHVRCHNRPLVQQPRHCPKCLKKDGGGGTRDVGALSVPPSMTVLTTYVSAEVKEKAQEKRALLEQNQTLLCELGQLEKRAEQLSMSLHGQKTSRDELLEKQKTTEQNIRRLLTFVNAMKGLPPPSPSPTSPPPLVPVTVAVQATPTPTPPPSEPSPPAVSLPDAKQQSELPHSTPPPASPASLPPSPVQTSPTLEADAEKQSDLASAEQMYVSEPLVTPAAEPPPPGPANGLQDPRVTEGSSTSDRLHRRESNSEKLPKSTL